MAEEIATDRLLLRRPRIADAAALASWIYDPAVARQTGGIPHPYSEADARSWIETRPAQWDSGLERSYVVTRQEAVIGTASLFRPTSAGVFETGYMLSRDAWGQGYMTEAVGGMIAALRDELQLIKVTASIFADNPGSMKVLEKLGFLRTAEVTLTSVARGGDGPGYLYELDLIADTP